jgi:hypothetical protein
VAGLIVALNVISLLIVRKIEYWHVASAITVLLLIGYAPQDRK